jgi:hypothetical protein
VTAKFYENQQKLNRPAALLIGRYGGLVLFTHIWRTKYLISSGWGMRGFPTPGAYDKKLKFFTVSRGHRIPPAAKLSA